MRRSRSLPYAARLAALAMIPLLLIAAVAQSGSPPPASDAPDARDGSPAPPAPNASPSPQTQASAGEAGPDALAARLSAGLVGSKHDFTAGGQVGRDLCLPCHTPHLTTGEAALRVAQPPPRRVLRPSDSPDVELSAASLLCLSCHDGQVAPDVFAGAHATTWADRASGAAGSARARLAGHPVGTLYPANAPRYRSASAVESDGRLRLPGGRIQCTTCHDPHNVGRHAGLLIRSNERSALCLSCHRL